MNTYNTDTCVTRVSTAITRRVARIVTLLHVQAHVHVHVFLFQLSCLSTLYDDDVWNRVFFSSLSFLFSSLTVLWISAHPNCRDTRKSLLRTTALCRWTPRGKQQGNIHPKVPRCARACVPNRQIAAVRKIIVSPRTSETMRTKGANPKRNVLQRLIIRNKSAIIYDTQQNSSK
jgi:hypothetical protein